MLVTSLPKFMLALDHLILAMLLVVSLLFILSVLGSSCIQTQVDSPHRKCGGRYSQCDLCCCGGGCSCNEDQFRYDIV